MNSKEVSGRIIDTLKKFSTEEMKCFDLTEIFINRKKAYVNMLCTAVNEDIRATRV